MRKNECELLYVKTEKDGAYSEDVYKYPLLIGCDVLKTFSLNYYDRQNRNKRKSINLNIPSYYVDLHADEGYELEYLNFENKRYKIENILDDRDRGDMYVILDCEEDRYG